MLRSLVVVGRSVMVLASVPACGDDSGAGEDSQRAHSCEPSPQSPKVLAAALFGPGELAIDDARVYWVSRSREVQRVVKIGGAIDVVVPDAGEVKGLAVDDQGVYWGTQDALMSLPKQGPGPVVLAPDTVAESITSDAGGIYWLHGSTGWLYILERGGSTPTRLGLGGVYGFGLTVDASTIYVACDCGEQDIVAASRSGGPVAPLVGNLGGVDNPQSVAVDSTDIYWVDSGDPFVPEGAYVATSRKDGTQARIITRDVTRPIDIAVDDAFAYWVEWGNGGADGRLMAVPKSGDEPMVLAGGLPHPRSLSLDADFVYWSNEGTEGSDSSDGSVMRVAKPTCR